MTANTFFFAGNDLITIPRFSGGSPVILIWVWIASKAELIFSSAVISLIGLKTPAFRSLPVQAPRNSLNDQDAYSETGTKLGVQNKNFCAASQTDITGG